MLEQAYGMQGVGKGAGTWHGVVNVLGGERQHDDGAVDEEVPLRGRPVHRCNGGGGTVDEGLKGSSGAAVQVLYRGCLQLLQCAGEHARHLLPDGELGGSEGVRPALACQVPYVSSVAAAKGAGDRRGPVVGVVGGDELVAVVLHASDADAVVVVVSPWCASERVPEQGNRPELGGAYDSVAAGCDGPSDEVGWTGGWGGAGVLFAMVSPKRFSR